MDAARTSLTSRTNDAWVAALRGEREESAEAVRELEAYLRRVLARIGSARLQEEEIAERIQESLARIVEALPSFRGDSAFTTWATGVALRATFTELRRRRVRESRRDAFGALEDELRAVAPSRTPTPDETVARADLMRALERAIATRLTDRQRLAVLAELRGIPTIEIARRLGTTPNALYKLTHDARKRLRKALVAEGFTAETMHACLAGASR